MAKNRDDLLKVLEQLSLNIAEQVVVDRAINRLKTTHESEARVLGSLQSGFRGLAFFTELQKPDFARDNAVMWSMWLGNLR